MPKEKTMKIKAVIFDIELVELLNGKDNMFNWFLHRGESVNSSFVPIKTIIIENELNNRKTRLPKNIKPDFLGNARMAGKFLEDAGIKPENTLFVSDNEEHIEFCNEKYRTVLLKPSFTSKAGNPNLTKCRPRYRTHDFDELTRIVNLIEWKEGE
ncbi:MAG: hypothetical protein A3G49_01425 [Candidatus Sungbacteria bacterium RIFCSPLOWO2_12_FULL_41_11]|uniref:FCP1 homology domain-containing protein n=1 Tax=Candidatus Sungbacteria bacterium RIFCSPLOWO2_12_FULL_41_11 TaxID=1802286 RepID=A0A1G2LQS7_9BACT|nr:MAG: hypothetical protein A3G49_01425 [Candidatus Sungbacteria bacterium RIFCSPLOWO2_12_FULL_41_11]